MARLEHLTFTSELKTSLLETLVKTNKIQLWVRYDDDFDALVIRFVPDAETIVHYLDDHVALLYQPTSKEIVGMQIEDFVHSFLPLHDTVQKVWRLSDADAKIETMGDLILAFERKTPEVAREVVKAAEDVLHREGVELNGVL